MGRERRTQSGGFVCKWDLLVVHKLVVYFAKSGCWCERAGDEQEEVIYTRNAH